MAVSVGNIIFGIQMDLKDIKSQLNSLEGGFNTAFGRIQSQFKRFAGTLGVGLSVGALVGFAKEVANVAGQLEDLSQKTGISAQALSALKPIAEQNSSSIQDFATGMTRLIRGLADTGAAGDKTRKALGDLGFSTAQLRQFTAAQRVSSASLRRSLPLSRIRPSVPP